MRKISTLDLTYENQLIKSDFMREFSQLYDSNMLMIGAAIDTLEKRIAEYCDTRYCSLTGSGTMALQVAAKALNIGQGDEVIVPANTFFASAIAFYHAGAKIVLADVDPDTWNLSPETVRHVITPKTKAICLVHLYGNLADPMEFKEFNVPVIEDASHAFGGILRGKPSGSLGDIAGFSAGPIKGFGGLGHAGFLTYNQESYRSYIDAFINNGQTARHYAEIVGHNFRIDSVNALFLLKKLSYWEHLMNRRKNVIRIYDTYFDQAGIQRQARLIESDPSLWVYVIRTQASVRDNVVTYLKEKAGINTLVQYTFTINQLPVWHDIAANTAEVPFSEKLSTEIFSLPVHSGLSSQDAMFICEKVSEAINEYR